MKILMLIDSMNIGGAETHVEILATELCKLGHKVIILSSGGALQNKLVHQGLTCLTFPKITQDTKRTYPNRPSKVNLSSPWLFRFLTSRSIANELICCERPEIVHAHTRACAFLVHKICKKHKIPLIVTAHAKFSMKFPKNLLSRWGDETIAVSEDIENHLIDNAVRKNQIHVIPNGVRLPKNEILLSQMPQKENENAKNSLC